MNQEYHKIETLYNRDVKGTKKLIEGDFRNPVYSYLSSLNFMWTEKINGTNTRIYWDGHTISFGGRTDKAQIQPNLMKYLTETFSNTETEELFEQMFGEKEVILYGEGYGAGIQSGGNYRPDCSFILFDVKINGLWLEWDNVEEIGEAFGIDVVPVLGKGTLEEAVKFVKTKPKSTIGTAPMEGIVARPLVGLCDRRGNRIIVKIKVEDFV